MIWGKLNDDGEIGGVLYEVKSSLDKLNFTVWLEVKYNDAKSFLISSDIGINPGSLVLVCPFLSMVIGLPLLLPNFKFCPYLPLYIISPEFCTRGLIDFSVNVFCVGVDGVVWLGMPSSAFL